MDQSLAHNLAALRSQFGSGPLFARSEGSTFEIDGVEFVCDYQPDSTARRFFLVKNPEAVPGFLERAEQFSGGNVVELGIAEGGSVALLALAARPRRLVGVDLEPVRRAALDQLVDQRGLTENVHLHYGLDQADRAGLAAAVRNSLDDEPIDLVIDDASHQLDATRTSFETLFPLVRPGGLYVIEDWSADHRFRLAVAKQLQRDPEARARLRDGLRAGATDPAAIARPLSDLVVELVLARASHEQELIDEVVIGRFDVAIRRGTGTSTPESFRLESLVRDYFRYLPESPG